MVAVFGKGRLAWNMSLVFDTGKIQKTLRGLFSSVLQKAVEVMCIVPKRCNDMMNVGRLQGFDVRSPSIPLILLG